MAVSYSIGGVGYSAPSFEEMMNPAKFIQDRYDNYLLKLAEQEEKASLASILLDKDDPLRQEIDSYKEDVQKLGDTFMQSGYNADSLNSLLGLKKQYSERIAPIELASKKLVELNKQRADLLVKDPSLLFKSNPDELSVQGLMDDPSFNYVTSSGKTIANSAAEMVKGIATQFVSNGYTGVETIDDVLYQFLDKKGYTLPEVMSLIANNDYLLEEVANKALEMNGVDKSWHGYKQALESAKAGIIAASQGPHAISRQLIPTERGGGYGSYTPTNPTKDSPTLSITKVNIENLPTNNTEGTTITPSFYRQGNTRAAIDYSNDIEALKDTPMNTNYKAFMKGLVETNSPFATEAKALLDLGVDTVEVANSNGYLYTEDDIRKSKSLSASQKERLTKATKLIRDYASFYGYPEGVDLTVLDLFDLSKKSTASSNRVIGKYLDFKIDNKAIIDSVKADFSEGAYVKQVIGVDRAGNHITKSVQVSEDLAKSINQGTIQLKISLSDPTGLIVRHGSNSYRIAFNNPAMNESLNSTKKKLESLYNLRREEFLDPSEDNFNDDSLYKIYSRKLEESGLAKELMPYFQDALPDYINRTMGLALLLPSIGSFSDNINKSANSALKKSKVPYTYLHKLLEESFLELYRTDNPNVHYYNNRIDNLGQQMMNTVLNGYGVVYSAEKGNPNN